jgi:small subunit ribosomal protein S20
MPVTESAKKALRNAQAKHDRNAQVKAELKRVLKNATVENMSSVVSTVDKAAKREIIHPNKAARIKSRLSRILAGTAPVKAAKKATSKKTIARVKAKAKAARAANAGK